MRRSRRYNIGIILFTVFLIGLFFFTFKNKATAGGGTPAQIVNYEQILVHKGETLSEISNQYVNQYSHLTSEEYKREIVRINALKTDYLYSSQYLMLPIYE